MMYLIVKPCMIGWDLLQIKNKSPQILNLWILRLYFTADEILGAYALDAGVFGGISTMFFI